LIGPPEKVYVPLVWLMVTEPGVTPAAAMLTGPTPALPKVTKFESW
jgi:hypothetical protein